MRPVRAPRLRPQCHKAKTLVGRECVDDAGRGTGKMEVNEAKSSQCAKAVQDVQRRLPHARVCYVSVSRLGPLAKTHTTRHCLCFSFRDAFCVMANDNVIATALPSDQMRAQI